MSAASLTPALTTYAGGGLTARLGPNDTVLVGTDVQEVAAVAEAVDSLGDRYLRHVYTEAELRSSGYPGRAPSEVASSLAARFAVKESVVKALGAAEPRLPWTSVAVVPGDDGGWTLELTGTMLEIATARGVGRWTLSFSHDGAYAVATVIGIVCVTDAGDQSVTGNHHV